MNEKKLLPFYSLRKDPVCMFLIVVCPFMSSFCITGGLRSDSKITITIGIVFFLMSITVVCFGRYFERNHKMIMDNFEEDHRQIMDGLEKTERRIAGSLEKYRWIMDDLEEDQRRTR